MKYGYVLCEGQTEEGFVKGILQPYMSSFDIYLEPVLLGGVSRYAKIRDHLVRLSRNREWFVTTMLDYYQIPSDTPGWENWVNPDPMPQVYKIEKAMKDDLNLRIKTEHFYPNLIVHEFEALLFSNVSCFDVCDGITEHARKELAKIRKKYGTPELINNSVDTAPSKRIIKVYPEYSKTIDGRRVAEDIGIEKMIAECPHFSEWIETLKKISKDNG